MKKVKTWRKLLVMVLTALTISLGLTGCNRHSEHPHGEHPSKEHPNKEHPAGEHPQ